MLTLAIDQSTRTCSIALLNDRQVIARENWEEARSGDRQLFPVLHRILDGVSTAVSDIDMFAVGLGPGTFSGLRMSLSAFQAMALPGKKPVRGISSGEAIAQDILDARKLAGPLVIAGDARRGRLWWAEFRQSDSKLNMTRTFSLIKQDELPPLLSKGTTVATPDWDRIAETLKALLPSAANLIEERIVPRAETVGLLALEHPDPAASGDPLTPIYLHPPVFVEPRFAPAADKT